MPVLELRSSLRRFPIGRKRAIFVTPEDGYKSHQEFLDKLDGGDLDATLGTELKKLSKDQLEQLAQVLLEREAKRS